MPRTAAVLFLLVPGALACGPAPVPVESASAPAAPAGQLPPGHPPIGGGAGPPAARSAADLRFSGVVRLRGALASTQEGYVMVSIKPEGIKMPVFSRKYALSEATPGEDGELRLAFQLDQDDMLGMLPPGGLVLEARFDPDGMVESQEGVVVATVPVTLDESAAEIVLGG
jgi:hypothetical protein